MNWYGGVPPTRGDCKDGPRPCPFLRCKYHIAPELSKPDELVKLMNGEHPCCVLDEIDKRNGDMRTLAEVGEVFGITRERVRQIESRAVKKLERRISEETLEVKEPGPPWVSK